MSQDKPLVSVIVPAYNAAKTIKECVKSLLNQSYGTYEVIVVDNNSTDDTRRILESFGEKIKTLKEVKKGSFAARNTGARNSQGEILVFVDADCIVENDWLEKLTKPLVSDDEIATYGGSVDAQETRWSRMEHVFEEETISSLSVGEHTVMGDTKNMAVLRRVFDELGGFDESFRFSGDTDFGLRLAEGGYRIRLIQGCRVLHHFKATFGRIIKNKFRHGFWGVVNYVKHGKYLKSYGEVLREVKAAVIILSLSLIILVADTAFNGGLTDTLYLISALGMISSFFLLAGGTHSITPIVKKGLTDRNIYALVHTTAWRLGALFYLLQHPGILHRIP